MAEEELKGSGVVTQAAWTSVKEIGGCGERVRPERG
jgi:hypothetical protein